MTLISERSTVGHADIEAMGVGWGPPNPSVLPTIVGGDGSVVAFRTRPAVAMGALDDRLVIDSEPLVSAQDLLGRSWWIPAEAVWSDVDSGRQPQHPWPRGLAAGSSREVALLAGLSDRLGWEANMSREAGRVLPVLDGIADACGLGLTVYDGRLDHRVPTVVVVGDTFVRWGSGSTLSSAYRRAVHGDEGTTGHDVELEDLRWLLSVEGIDVVAVDLGTPLIRRAGVVRYSVQLTTASHEPGRSWDADPVN
ncbi:MAG: hypothetical protein ABW195_16400 [Ilumatobacteraceae bacterium]